MSSKLVIITQWQCTKQAQSINKMFKQHICWRLWIDTLVGIIERGVKQCNPSISQNHRFITVTVPTEHQLFDRRKVVASVVQVPALYTTYL